MDRPSPPRRRTITPVASLLALALLAAPAQADGVFRPAPPLAGEAIVVEVTPRPFDFVGQVPPNRFYAPPPIRQFFVSPGPFYDPGRIVVYEGVRDPVVVRRRPGLPAPTMPPGPSLAPVNPPGCFDGPGDRIECPPVRHTW